MQSKLWSILQYGYLLIAVIFLVEGILHINVNLTQSVIYFLFSGLCVFLFFFKRNFRRKIEQRNKEKQ